MINMPKSTSSLVLLRLSITKQTKTTVQHPHRKKITGVAQR
jgi:hypothetical protein